MAATGGPHDPPDAGASAGGTEPDARFTFANERTFLAWTRTALAFVVAGLAIVQLLPPFPGVPWGRRLLGIPLIVLGAVDFRGQLRPMGTQPAGAAPRRAAAPVSSALDPGRDYRGPGGRVRRHSLALGHRAALMAVPDDLEELDPGLARERDQLAWVRTALSFGAVGAAILKASVAAGLAVVAMSFLIWGVRRVLPDTDATDSRPRRLLLVAVAVAAVSRSSARGGAPGARGRPEVCRTAVCRTAVCRTGARVATWPIRPMSGEAQSADVLFLHLRR